MKKFLVAVGIGLALTSAAWAGEPPVWTYTETRSTWRGDWDGGKSQTLEGTISDGNWTFTVENVTGGDCFELTGYSAGSGVLDMSTLPKISDDSRAFARLYMDKCDNLADANGIKFQDVVTKVVFPPFLGATTWDGSKMAPGREPAWFNCSSLVKFQNVTEADFSHCTELSRVYSMFTAKHPALTTLRLPEEVQTVKNSVFTAPNLKAIYWNGPVPTSVDKSAWVAGQTNFVLQAYAASWAAACEVEHPLETGKVGQLKSDYVGMEYGRTKCVYVAFADEGGSDDPDTPGGGDDPETPGEESEPASTNLTVELYAPVAGEADFYSVRGAALKAGASVDDTQKPVIFAIKAVELDGLAYWKFGVSNLWCGMSYALCQSKELVPTDDFSPVTNAPAGGEAQSGCEAATLCIVHSDGSVKRTDNRYAEETPADPKPVHSAIALAVEGWTGPYDGLAHGAAVKSVNPSDAIVKWTMDGGSEFADASPTLTHVGELTVRARAEKAATAGTVWEPAEATADIKITPAVNEWAVEPSLSETSWKVGDEKPTVNNGQAKFGEVSANYTQATLPTAAGSYEATFTVPSSGDWSNVLSKSIPFTITDGGEEPPEEPDDPPSGDTVRLNVLFTGAAYGVCEKTVTKGQAQAVDFSPLVKNVSVAAASTSAGTVSGSTLSLPASALGADLTVNVMLRESASAGAVEVGGWKTRLANADVNGDGIVKVLALGHSYVDDVSSYFADAVAQMRALGDKTKFVYCNSFYPGCKVSEYVSFLNSDSSAVTMRAFYTDDVPAAERPKRADGTEFPSRTGAWGDYYAGKMSDHLKACDDWDLIVINEGVHAIPSASVVSSYKALIREKLKAWGCTTEPLIGWYMTWAWGPLATTSTCNLSMYYQNSSDVHYSKIVAGVESCKGQFDFVIPVGTALQNLAALEPHNTANAPDYKGTSSRFQRDGTCHLDFICGRWTATLAYLSTLGFDVSGTHFPNERKYENEGAVFVMRPVQDVMCHLCANAAIAKPAAVTDLPWASTDYEFACACGASHDYGATKTVAKTCTADGYTTKTCAACGYEHRTAWVPMSHEDTAVVTAPDCTHAGYTTHKCADCGQTYETDRVRALGHDYAETVDKAACSVTYTCRRAGCGKTYTKVYNHLVKNWTVTKAPTYTTKGERQGTCEICGATVTEDVDVLNDFAFHWNYSNPDDAAATISRIKTFCTTKDAGNQFEYVPDEGVLRFWAGMDPFISWESAWFNGTHKSITRGFEILTPEGKTPRRFTLKGGTGKFLQPVGSMSRSYTDPGIIFAKDDGGYWSYQICCKCDSTLLYYFCYTGYSSNSAQWAPGGNGTSYPILDVDGEKVDFGNVQQNNNRNQLNFLAENGFLSGEKLTEQTVGYITYQYDVTVADDGKITVQGSLHYDRDGVTWTAKGAACVFDLAKDFNKVGNNSHDPKGLVPVFGLHHKPHAEPAGELRSANDKGYNTTDVTSIDAVYE